MCLFLYLCVFLTAVGMVGARFPLTGVFPHPALPRVLSVSSTCTMYIYISSQSEQEILYIDHAASLALLALVIGGTNSNLRVFNRVVEHPVPTLFWTLEEVGSLMPGSHHYSRRVFRNRNQ